MNKFTAIKFKSFFGAVYVDPKEIVAVFEGGNDEARLVLRGGTNITVLESSDSVMKRLGVQDV